MFMTDIQPRYCLKLGPTQALLAAVRQGWLGANEHQCWARPLPKGLIRPSPVTSNISDPAGLGTQLRALTREQQGLTGRSKLKVLLHFPRPAILVIPDLSVRPVVFSIDNLPASYEEQAALVRWRLGQEQLFPLAGTKVVFQILGHGDSKKKGPFSILAIAIRESILAQYEAACDAAGFSPVEVDTPTFRLFNLWARANARAKSENLEDLAWVSLLDGGLTVLIIRAGRLVYMRTKGLTVGDPSGPLSGLPGDEVNGTIRDILASIEYCTEAQPGLDINRIIVACEEPGSIMVGQLSHQLDIDVEEVGWDQAKGAGWKSSSQEIPPTAMSAVAGLLGR